MNDSLDSRSINDYMTAEQDRRKEVSDTRVFRGFAFGSDHFFVGSRLSVGALETQRSKRVVVKRFRIEKFKDELVKALFADRFAEKVESLPSQCAEIEVEWKNFKEFVLQIAEECLGNSSFRSGNKKTSCWSDEIKGAILEKRKLFLVWLQDKTKDKLLTYRAFKSQFAKNSNDLYGRAKQQMMDY